MLIKRLAILVLSGLILAGCMARKRLESPPTPRLPELCDLPSVIRGKRVEIGLFDTAGAEIGGGHHEGLLQVRQPWIFGLKREQKDALYDNAASLAALAFVSELKRQGVRVAGLKPRGAGQRGPARLRISGRVASVEINTYGRGTVEGFGGAGDYWEATVIFKDMVFEDLLSHRVLWQGDVNAYAKLNGSPVQLDWTVLDVVLKSLRMGMAMSGASPDPLKVLRAARNFEATYSIKEVPATPMEVAGRVGAVKFLFELR